MATVSNHISLYLGRRRLSILKRKRLPILKIVRVFSFYQSTVKVKSDKTGSFIPELINLKMNDIDVSVDECLKILPKLKCNFKFNFTFKI